MVDGVTLRFKKSKMLERIKAEGREDLIDETVLKIMDNLDGQEVSSANWNRQVYGEDVYSCYGKDGKVYDVAACDCE
jgi:hypothetical protein